MTKNSQYIILVFSLVLAFASCKKETVIATPPAPPAVTTLPPIAVAGKMQNVQQSVNNVILTGSGITKNGSIVAYFWTLVSGPNVPVLSSPSSSQTTVSGITAGRYIFNLAVVDNIGLTGVDTVSLIVRPNPITYLTIRPYKNPYEGYFDVYYPDTWFTNIEMPIGAWTSNGSPETYRECIKFDYSAIPSGSIIDSAVLYLYAMPTPLGGHAPDAHYGTGNACYIQRITSNWITSVSPFTWNRQPTFVTNNQAVLPQTTSGFQNDVVDVTALVKDMFPNNNNGFLITLQNEAIYNIRQYASSNYSDSTVRPKILIKYH